MFSFPHLTSPTSFRVTSTGSRSKNRCTLKNKNALMAVKYGSPLTVQDHEPIHRKGRCTLKSGEPAERCLEPTVLKSNPRTFFLKKEQCRDVRCPHERRERERRNQSEALKLPPPQASLSLICTWPRIKNWSLLWNKEQCFSLWRLLCGNGEQLTESLLERESKERGTALEKMESLFCRLIACLDSQ